MRGPDPFGSAVRDHHLGLGGPDCLIEREDGFKSIEPLEPYFEGEEDWAREEVEVLSRAGRRILDIGCGPGRHLLGLQERASLAVGLDISSLVLEVCRGRGGRCLVLGSSRRLPFRPGAFDTVILMSNGLGLSGGSSETLEMLGEVKRTVGRGGLLIAHTTDPTDPESGVDEHYRLENITRKRPLGLLRIRLRYGGLVGPWFKLMLMTPREVRSHLFTAGFRLRRSIAWGASRLYLSSS